MLHIYRSICFKVLSLYSTGTVFSKSISFWKNLGIFLSQKYETIWLIPFKFPANLILIWEQQFSIFREKSWNWLFSRPFKKFLVWYCLIPSQIFPEFSGNFLGNGTLVQMPHPGLEKMYVLPSLVSRLVNKKGSNADPCKAKQRQPYWDGIV